MAVKFIISYSDKTHVDLVHIRPLFPVDLDIDVQLVHDLSNVLILEALSFHHVTPVTGGVAYTQEDELVLCHSCPKGFLSPWIPGQLIQINIF